MYGTYHGSREFRSLYRVEKRGDEVRCNPKANPLHFTDWTRIYTEPTRETRTEDGDTFDVLIVDEWQMTIPEAVQAALHHFRLHEQREAFLDQHTAEDAEQPEDQPCG